MQEIDNIDIDNNNSNKDNIKDSVNIKHPGGRPKKLRKPRGRPKTLTHQIDEALKLLDDELPNLIRRLIHLAYEKNDRDALIYLIDRKMGRPRQEIDSRIRTQIIVSPEDYQVAIQQVRDQEKLLLGSGNLEANNQ